jgi:hypothetical protein
MSFRTLGYYAILPRPEFAEWLRLRTEPDLIEVLTEPQLISNDEFIGKTSWNEPENLLRVKLLFLAGLRDLRQLANDAGCEAILGSSEICSSLFDRWWAIQRFDDVHHVNDFMGEMTKFIKSVSSTGNPVVDRWIDEMKSKNA